MRTWAARAKIKSDKVVENIENERDLMQVGVRACVCVWAHARVSVCVSVHACVGARARL